MKQKVFITKRQNTAVSVDQTATAQFYDVGAVIESFQPGQTCQLQIQSSNDGAEWRRIMDFYLDDQTELVAPAVYVEDLSVRMVRIAHVGNPQFTVWISEVNK